MNPNFARLRRTQENVSKWPKKYTDIIIQTTKSLTLT